MQFVKDYTPYTTVGNWAKSFWEYTPDKKTYKFDIYAARWFYWDPLNKRKALNDSQIQDVNRQEEIMDKLLELYPNLNQTSSQSKVHELIEMCAQEQMQIFLKHWFKAYTHLEPSNGVNLTTSFPFQIIVPSDTLKPTNVRKICVILGSTPKWTTPYEPWRSVTNDNMPSFCSSYFFKPTKELYEDIIGKFGQNQFPTKLSVIGEMSINEIIMIAELKTIKESKKEISDIFTQIALCLAGYDADGASAIKPTQLFANVFDRILIPAYYREESEIQRHSDSGTSFDARQIKLLRAAHNFVVATQLMPEYTVYKETMITEHKNTTNTELLNCLLGFVPLANKDEFRNQLAEHGLIIPLENEWLFSGSGRTRTANFLFFGIRSNNRPMAVASVSVLVMQVFIAIFYTLAFTQLLVRSGNEVRPDGTILTHQTKIITADLIPTLTRVFKAYLSWNTYRMRKDKKYVLSASDVIQGIIHIIETFSKNHIEANTFFLNACLLGYLTKRAFLTNSDNKRNPILDCFSYLLYLIGLFGLIIGTAYDLGIRSVESPTLMHKLFQNKDIPYFLVALGAIPLGLASAPWAVFIGAGSMFLVNNGTLEHGIKWTSSPQDILIKLKLGVEYLITKPEKSFTDKNSLIGLLNGLLQGPLGWVVSPLPYLIAFVSSQIPNFGYGDMSVYPYHILGDREWHATPQSFDAAFKPVI